MSTGNRPPRTVRPGWASLVAAAVVATAGVGRAQDPGGAAVPRFDPVAAMTAAQGNPLTTALGSSTPGEGSGVMPINCASCGSGGGMPAGPGVWGYGKHGGAGLAEACGLGGCGSEGCGEAGCVPGRPPCETCEGHTRLGRIFCAFHNALCCPDPCYEPRWSCGPNAALFVDYARPATITRLRWDSGQNVIQPDRAEYFWAAQGRKGPGTLANGRVVNPEQSVDYNELHLYQEFATDRFSFFINMPYRNIDSTVNGGAGGFGDLSLGTKSLLLDSELIQTTFQFVTTIPTGVTKTGIGTGHVSLDPSLLWAVKLYTDTYWQSQLGYWIPISPSTVNGSNFSGGVLHYANSLNHVLCRPMRDVSIVGSLESVGYTFTAGQFTDPGTGLPVSANNQTYFGVGPGFRTCICDRLDVGFGMLFSVTNPHFADQLYRTEVRFRY